MLVGEIVKRDAAVREDALDAKCTNLALFSGHYLGAKGYEHFGTGPDADLFCRFC